MSEMYAVPLSQLISLNDNRHNDSLARTWPMANTELRAVIRGRLIVRYLKRRGTRPDQTNQTGPDHVTPYLIVFSLNSNWLTESPLPGIKEWLGLARTDLSLSQLNIPTFHILQRNIRHRPATIVFIKYKANGNFSRYNQKPFINLRYSSASMVVI